MTSSLVKLRVSIFLNAGINAVSCRVHRYDTSMYCTIQAVRGCMLLHLVCRSYVLAHTYPSRATYVCSMYLYGSDTIWTLEGQHVIHKAMSSSLVPAVCTNLLIHTGLHTTDQSRSMQTTRVHTYGHYRFSNSDGTSLFWYSTRALGDKSAWRKGEHNSLHGGVWTPQSRH